MKVPLFLLFLAMMANFSVIAAEKSKKQPLTEEQIRQTLNRVVIPQANFQNTSVREAVNFLDAEIRRRNPHGPRIPILIDIDPFFGPAAPPEGADPAFVNGDPLRCSTDTRFTVSLHDIPAFELLRYVTGLCNTEFHIRADGVHIVDWGDAGPMFTRTLRIPADFFPAFEREDRLFHTEHIAEMKKDFAAYLASNGLQLPAGASATLNSEAVRLTVHTTEDQFATIRKILATDRPASTFPVPGPDIPKAIEGLPREGVSDWRKAETDTAKKLRTICLPKVDWQNVSLGQAAVLLTKMSARYDHESRHTKRGVIIKMHDYPDSPSPPNFNYSATNVLLFDAVRAIADICICMASVDEHGVEWRTGYPERSICTRTYFLPPSTVEQLAGWPESNNEDISVPWLQQITFLPNNGTEYIAKRHQLIVTATLAAQQPIQQGNDNAWRDYYASQKTKGQKAD